MWDRVWELLLVNAKHPSVHPSVMTFFSSFTGCLSLCSQHWCTCNILHRFIQVSIQIFCPLLKWSWALKSNVLLTLTPTLVTASWVWGKAVPCWLSEWKRELLKSRAAHVLLVWEGRCLNSSLLDGCYFSISWCSISTDDVKEFIALWWESTICRQMTLLMSGGLSRSCYDCTILTSFGFPLFWSK